MTAFGIWTRDNAHETRAKVRFHWEITTENPGQHFAVSGCSVRYG